jgi:hypothetical protein
MPAHHPGAHRFGALYAANSHLPSENGEEPLRKNRLIFQLLAAELLNWYARQEKALALKNSGLTTLDLQILNAIARGQRLDSIAEDLDISLHALRRRHVRSINQYEAQDKNDRGSCAFGLRTGIPRNRVGAQGGLCHTQRSLRNPLA